MNDTDKRDEHLYRIEHLIQRGETILRNVRLGTRFSTIGTDGANALATLATELAYYVARHDALAPPSGEEIVRQQMAREAAVPLPKVFMTIRRDHDDGREHVLGVSSTKDSAEKHALIHMQDPLEGGKPWHPHSGVDGERGWKSNDGHWYVFIRDTPVTP